MIRRFRKLPRFWRILIGTLAALMIPVVVMAERYNIHSNHNHPISGSYDGNVPQDQQELMDRAGREAAEQRASGIQTPSDLMVRFPNEEIEKIEQETGYDVKYNEFLPSRYTLEMVYEDTNWWDLDEQISNTGHFFSHGTTNAIWMQLVQMSFSVIDFTVDVFTLNVAERFADEIGNGIRNYAGFAADGSLKSEGLWGHLLTGVIFMVGCWAVFIGLIMRRFHRFWLGILSSMLIMIGFIGFYLNASGVLKVMNDGVEQLSTWVLEASQTFTMDKEIPQEAYPYVLADHMYHMNTYIPYVIQQHNGIPVNTVELEDAEPDVPVQQRRVFRDEIENERRQREEAERLANQGRVSHDRIHAILNHPLGSTDRKEAVIKERDKYDNKLVTTLGTQERLKSMGLLAVLVVLETIVYFLIDMAAALFMILFILLTLLSPVIGLVAIFPPFTHIAKKWFELWFMTLIGKLLITTFLSLLFFISNLMFKIVPPEDGYHKTLIWQILILLAVIIFRKPLFGIFVRPATQVYVRTGRTIYERSKQAFRQGRQRLRSGLRNRSRERGGMAA